MKNVADIYPLSPMQEVMLLHSVAHDAMARTGAVDGVPGAGGPAHRGNALFNQFCYEIEGALDLDAFGRAWQRVFDRHPALRSVFLWKDLKAPVQVVKKQAELPLTVVDWTNEPADEPTGKLQEYCLDDRARGFDLIRGPLTRVALARCGPNRTFVIWSSHHLLIDRWCVSTLLYDLFEYYAAEMESRPPSLPAAGRFRDYIAWVQGQDASRAELFWRQTLRGFRRPSFLASVPSAAGARSHGEDPAPVATEPLHRSITAQTTESLRTLARRHGVTLGTVVQGAWALLLNRLTGLQDVVFGVVASGRPPQLPGVESMVGSFINNVPVRVQIDDAINLADWLRAMQANQRARLPFEHVSLTRMQNEWSDLPPGTNLFDHLLVWLAAHDTPEIAGLRLRALPGELTTAYPLTVGIAENASTVDIYAYRDAADGLDMDVGALLDAFEQILREMAASGADALLGRWDGFRQDAGYQPPSPSEDTPPTGLPHAHSVAGTTSGEAPPEPVAAGREKAERELLLDLLRAEWQRLLPERQIGLDDDFFALGGTSLRAATLHTRLEAATHVSVPMLSLFQTPTLRGMIETLVEKDWPLSPRVSVPLQAGHGGRPFFCIASPEVNTLGYSMLTRYLPEEQPVYVLQTPPTNHQPRRLHPSDLLALADTYNEALTEIQPEGPVQLLGMCSGAHIALEMAKRLHEMGRPASFFGIINTWAFHTRSRLYRVEMMRDRLQHYAKRLGSLAALDPQKRAEARNALQRRRRRASAADQAAPVERTRDPREPNSETPRISDESSGRATAAPGAAPDNPWLDEVGWARGDREIEVYPGTITVFRVKKQQSGRIRSKALGWDKHAQKARVEHLVAPDHDDILRDPYVQDLARRIAGCLDPAGERLGT